MRQKRQAAKVEAVENLKTKTAKEVDGRERIGQGSVYRLDKGAPLDYPTTTVENIDELVGDMLSKHAFTDCHIFLWTVQRMMPDAFKLLDKWGLKYSFTMVWRKVTVNGKTVGPKAIDGPRYNGEFILYARRGSPDLLNEASFPTVFDGVRREHSEKPEEFYEILRRYTGGRRLDMFNRRLIDGFEGWGIEAPDPVAQCAPNEAAVPPAEPDLEQAA